MILEKVYAFLIKLCCERIIFIASFLLFYCSCCSPGLGAGSGLGEGAGLGAGLGALDVSAIDTVLLEANNPEYAESEYILSANVSTPSAIISAAATIMTPSPAFAAPPPDSPATSPINAVPEKAEVKSLESTVPLNGTIFQYTVACGVLEADNVNVTCVLVVSFIDVVLVLIE